MNETQSERQSCTHQGPQPLLWRYHDTETGFDMCSCQDCGELVAMEPDLEGS